MLMQIHVLQNYAPSNLNRDDTGSPKDAMFGGYRRGRISSQCLKRSIRKSPTFAEAFADDGLLGQRTRLLPQLIGTELKAMNVDAATIEAVVSQVPKIGRKLDKNVQGTKEKGTEDVGVPMTRQLIFAGSNELQPLAERLLALYREHGPEKWRRLDLEKELDGSLPCSVDIAMFGRMTTSEAFEDVQAAVQVAHALSTNALAQEFDYYTAVDDLSGESGAGMIGDVEFNSSTYYKYLNLHWEQLLENLGGDVQVARRAVSALLEAAVMAHPSGKQNSFAAQNLPSFGLLVRRQDGVPISLANAFAKPVRPTKDDDDLVGLSVAALTKHWDALKKVYGDQGVQATACFHVEQEGRLKGLSGYDRGSVENAINAVIKST